MDQMKASSEGDSAVQVQSEMSPPSSCQWCVLKLNESPGFEPHVEAPDLLLPQPGSPREPEPDSE